MCLSTDTSFIAASTTFQPPDPVAFLGCLFLTQRVTFGKEAVYYLSHLYSCTLLEVWLVSGAVCSPEYCSCSLSQAPTCETMTAYLQIKVLLVYHTGILFIKLSADLFWPLPYNVYAYWTTAVTHYGPYK